MSTCVTQLSFCVRTVSHAPPKPWGNTVTGTRRCRSLLQEVVDRKCVCARSTTPTSLRFRINHLRAVRNSSAKPSFKSHRSPMRLGFCDLQRGADRLRMDSEADSSGQDPIATPRRTVQHDDSREGRKCGGTHLPKPHSPIEGSRDFLARREGLPHEAARHVVVSRATTTGVAVRQLHSATTDFAEVIRARLMVRYNVKIT